MIEFKTKFKGGMVRIPSKIKQESGLENGDPVIITIEREDE